jgi:hypothetical protein
LIYAHFFRNTTRVKGKGFVYTREFVGISVETCN